MGQGTSTLSPMMSFEAAGAKPVAGEGIPRRLKADVPPPTESKFGAKIDNW